MPANGRWDLIRRLMVIAYRVWTRSARFIQSAKFVGAGGGNGVLKVEKDGKGRGWGGGVLFTLEVSPNLSGQQPIDIWMCQLCQWHLRPLMRAGRWFWCEGPALRNSTSKPWCCSRNRTRRYTPMEYRVSKWVQCYFVEMRDRHG